ncbi:methionyl-tRNA formyltransferase [Paramagnetospirillum magneticum]|uniref:Methionyl-tRNA formyltransferase n=1 Tax=Paramagnetospirillum magneticum (strain ATCC 700264 / AMB-1) TaxID=342108 RepID=FMT_PARM1|nr:methionyl-tRNA formyltransferase [Paramagnetospirillum magneticum]Q2WAS9.1 RecName: Full=Methionyl-tRNA formyltransferase [Paramagnetospirillum magneticum AMB-1]BAE49046.1 Methionyl-tRNA formyltransferase [Paramagnetospirillum magneticum AMB-1]
MKLVFMGTPDFSVPILDSLIEAGHQVICVYSQPPRPAGRGHKEQLTPVHAFAHERGIPVRTPKSLKPAEAQAEFAALEADVAVVAAYGLILPQAVLDAPRLGCLNVHASLLPRWRGAAPIQRAILAGDAETGITIMQMDAGLDTGAMLSRESILLAPDTTAPWLHDMLAAMGARMIVETLARLEDDEPPAATPQPAEGVTYAHKLAKEEGLLDWRRNAVELDRKVRALNPWPGVWFEMAGERIKVLEAAVTPGSGAPGTVLDDQLTIACGKFALRPLKVQRAGKAPMTASEMLRGHAIPKGTVLG